MVAWRRRLLVALLFYGGLGIVLTWPLAAHLTTHVAGDGIDDPALAWNLWWIKARLLDQHQLDIFHVDWMFHPIAINLAFYTLTPLNGLLSIPLQTAVDLIVASNVILLSSFVIGGFGTYLLTTQELSFANVHRNTDDNGTAGRNLHYVALFAGIVYAFASSKLFYAGLGQFNIASSQWIPFCTLYVLRLARSNQRREGMRNALLAALFLVLQAWAELTYASFLLLFIGLAFLWSLGHRHLIVRRVISFGLLGLVFLVGIAPFLWAMIPDMRTEGDFFTSGGGFADSYSADLLGYLLPTQRHPWLGDWVDQFPFPHDKGQHIYLGYSALALALAGAVAWWRQKCAHRWVSFWLVATLFFWWMTLGAQLRWNGRPLPIPGPFALISQLPFFSGNR
ncbi:MAG: hypothetical protein KDE53_02135, partial [Caldilineaceae bacterium]|nr:hypothetical protein [Caldilineaceae bacterium]